MEVALRVVRRPAALMRPLGLLSFGNAYPWNEQDRHSWNKVFYADSCTPCSRMIYAPPVRPSLQLMRHRHAP
jgi:hypothetical protein